MKGEWWTAPAVADNGRTIIVTGRDDVAAFRRNPRMTIRIDISVPYTPDAQGFPYGEEAQVLEEMLERLRDTFDRDPVAVVTGVFTGDGSRDIVLYTLSTRIFERKLNEALSPLPTLPLHIEAANDAAWEAYDEMSQVRVDTDEV